MISLPVATSHSNYNKIGQILCLSYYYYRFSLIIKTILQGIKGDTCQDNQYQEYHFIIAKFLKELNTRNLSIMKKIIDLPRIILSQCECEVPGRAPSLYCQHTGRRKKHLLQYLKYYWTGSITCNPFVEKPISYRIQFSKKGVRTLTL